MGNQGMLSNREKNQKLAALKYRFRNIKIYMR